MGNVSSLMPREQAVTVGCLQRALIRYLGEERAFQEMQDYAGLHACARDPEAFADQALSQHVERLLARTLGSTPARLVLSFLLYRQDPLGEDILKLVDESVKALQQRDLLQNALDYAIQGITVIDRDLRLIAMNRAFIRIADLPDHLAHTGIMFEQIVRYNAQRGYYGEGSVDDLVVRRLNHMRTESEPRPLKLFPKGKDQPEVVIEMVSNQLPEGGVITTYTDITARVRAEEELHQLNASLEERVQERTTELTQAKALADDANASKTRFLAAASHDLQQPLHAARLFATTLLEREKERGDATDAENLCAALDGVEEIIGALLEISKLDTGATQIHLSNFRLDDILGALEKEFRPLAEAKKLKLKFVHTSLAVRSDRRILRRVLQNLISNAIKYTPRGKVLVGVRLKGDSLRVDVCDTGLGIPDNKLEAIFLEFERLEQGKHTAKGLGLGLSIVERALRILGHPLRVQSMLKRGSVFSIELPMSPILPEHDSNVPLQPTIVTPMEGMLVLAIDDEQPILDGMKNLLGKWGCEVITASDLRNARLCLRESGRIPDVIIADYNLGMGEGNGIEAITALRWTTHAATPAILLTAENSREVADEARAKNIYLHNKPVKPAVLRALLTQWRARSGS
jgi:signal transduction histidine kinase/CheY-like chemotaxis protein